MEDHNSDQYLQWTLPELKFACILFKAAKTFSILFTQFSVSSKTKSQNPDENINLSWSEAES